MKELINKNIEKFGHHITVVTSGAEPRYAYTIGVTQKSGFELLFAGGLYFMYEEILEIINSAVTHLQEFPKNNRFKINSYGEFAIVKAHHSWSRLMMLGYFDYYRRYDVDVFQIIPDSQHYTLEIPDMSIEWSESAQPVWKWLSKKWDYPFPESSTVVTDMDFLRGKKITELMRWHVDEWEAFTEPGSEVRKEDIRVISIGTLIGLDFSVDPVLRLSVGKGIWRNETDLIWRDWN